MEFTCKENYETWKVLLENEGIRSTAGRLNASGGFKNKRNIFQSYILLEVKSRPQKHAENKSNTGGT